MEAAVAAIVGRVPNVQAVYLFGSRASGLDVPDSDIDLAVLAERPLESVERWELQEELASLVGRDVDLVDLRSASTVLQVQVLKTSQVLLDKNRYARESFESIVLSDYARLNQERRGILADVEATGSVHG